jgi:hypothetical protein
MAPLFRLSGLGVVHRHKQQKAISRSSSYLFQNMESRLKYMKCIVKYQWIFLGLSFLPTAVKYYPTFFSHGWLHRYCRFDCRSLKQSESHEIFVFAFHIKIMFTLYCSLRITVAARSKAWTVCARSNAGIVTSNPTQDMNICIVCVYSVFVLFCV